MPRAPRRHLSKAPAIESAIRSRAAMRYPPTQPCARLVPLALGMRNGPDALAGASHCGEPPGGRARARGTSNESTGPAAPVACATSCRQPSPAWAAICGGHGQGPAEPLQNDPKPLPPKHPLPERRVGSEGRSTASVSAKLKCPVLAILKCPLFRGSGMPDPVLRHPGPSPPAASSRWAPFRRARRGAWRGRIRAERPRPAVECLIVL